MKALDAVLPSRPRTAPGLRAFFQPRSIALIGASDQPGKVGRAVGENLLTFPGHFFVVNPNHSTVLGRTSYPSVAVLPEAADLAIVATPASAVPEIVAECGARGIRAAVVLSAGFREVGAVGRERERRALAAARQHGVRLLGPNCLGLINPHAGLNAAFAGPISRTGGVAFLSQSGALCAALLDWSRQERIGLSALVSTGGMIDVSWGELLRHFGDDPATKSILLYLESVGDAADFMTAVRHVVPRKPIVVLKPGRTEMAAHAAASHTGALTGRDEVFGAAMRQAGVLRVDTLADLFALTKMLACPRRPAGRKLAIVTNAGGPGALAVDALAAGGGQLASLSTVTLHGLEETLPPCWSHGNPIDVLGDAKADRFDEAMKLLIEEPDSDGVLVMLTPQAMTNATAIALSVVHEAGTTAKPIFACWLGGDCVRTGRDILHSAGLPELMNPEAAARAFNHLWQLGELRDRADSVPDPLGTPAPGAVALLDGIRREGRRLLSEYESKQVMRLEGIPCVETRLAATEEEAATLATELGFPVVLKLHSRSLTHKSDVGGVQLDLRDTAAVRAAWRVIRQTVDERAGPGQFLGVTVQPMVRGDGRELIVGISTDAQFGPVVLFGTGGKFVEIFNDHALGLCPLNTEEARRLIAETKISGALESARGLPAIELLALARLVARFSRIPRLHPGIKEIDLNPLVIDDQGRCLALDARVILNAEESVSRPPVESPLP